MPGSLWAQGDVARADDAWNTPEARTLLERGRAAREGVVAEGSLQSYQALTEGHIYFYVDPEGGEQALIRVDQVAVELFWEAPDLVRQRIVGERSETRLPVRDFRYYLDRLTLVQYGFGDEIEVGHGLDVAGVPHPLARPPGGDPERERYDVRLADSVSLRLPGTDAPLRIHELQVRPRDPSQPAVLGSIFLNAADGQLVRMAITFTPASYVDPRTDRIQVSLDYGLWEGRYWLPNRQELEVRREVPELDFGVGTVIRAVLRVGDYELNAPMPSHLLGAPSVTQAPAGLRSAYPFRTGLFEEMQRDGVGGVVTRVDRRVLEAEAARLLGNRPPSGLSPLRFHLPDLSSVVRADRVRGVQGGMGSSLRVGGSGRIRGWGGYAAASGHPALRLELEVPGDGPWRFGGKATLNEGVDLGARPAAPGVVSTLGSLFWGEDYLDLYRRRGAWVAASRTLGEAGSASAIGGSLGGSPAGGGQTRLRVQGGIERHDPAPVRWESAPLGGRTASRGQASPEVTPGRFASLGLHLDHREEGVGFGGWGGPLGSRLELRGEGELLAGGAGVGLRVEGGAALSRRATDGSHEVRTHLAFGTRTGDVLVQQARYLGGRGTVPGIPFRQARGPIWALGGAEVSRDLQTPWVRLRGGVDLGWTDNTALAGVRAGVGLFFDLLRIDLARGMTREGEWQLLLGIDPLWWSRL